MFVVTRLHRLIKAMTSEVCIRRVPQLHPAEGPWWVWAWCSHCECILWKCRQCLTRGHKVRALNIPIDSLLKKTCSSNTGGRERLQTLGTGQTVLVKGQDSLPEPGQAPCPWSLCPQPFAINYSWTLSQNLFAVIVFGIFLSYFGYFYIPK